MRLRISIDDEDARAALRRLLALGADLSPLTRRVAATLEDSVAESFARQASPAGAWAPLKPATIADRIRRGYRAGPILERSGDLAGSVHSTHGPDSAAAGTNRRYAATQNYGRDGIPARPFLALWPEHEREIANDVREFVRRAWRGH